MNFTQPLQELRKRLHALDAERHALIQEIQKIENDLVLTETQNFISLLDKPAMEFSPTTSQEKVTLFLKLFRCRESVHPKRWENQRTGKSGYSPVCANEWIRPICQKPQIKCSECSHQKFLPLNELAVESHLKGQETIGTYAIREDDKCIFLACDFDEANWQTDVLTYKKTARQMGVDVAIERSRSGKGAHAWIFFEEPVPARLARSLGTLILTRTIERRHTLSLASYDRFFPSQDYLPNGGFGNLIALPLQRVPRELGNSCFVDEKFNVILDQWAYLAQVHRLSLQNIKRLIENYLPQRSNGFDDISWKTDRNIIEPNDNIKIGTVLHGQFKISLNSMIHVPLNGLPGKIVNLLKKVATFPNPEFYKLQRMRMQTYPHHRIIFSGEIREEELLLPRGVLDRVTQIFKASGGSLIIRDERFVKKKIRVSFKGELNQMQKEALKSIKKFDIGILVAPPAAGKTVIGCALVAERKISTLILVHRRPLLDQWKERLLAFLDIDPKDIGNLSGYKKRSTGKIDLAMLQTLTRLEDLGEIASKYSQIIIDECHHIPATSFEAILKQIPARFVLGLTATPYRKDHLEKILFHQCGPIRHEIKSADGGILKKKVTIHESGFKMNDELGNKPPYYVLIQALISNEIRNKKIALHTVDAVKSGHFPLLISDRKEHLDILSRLIETTAAQEINQSTLKIIRFESDLSQKQRRLSLEEVASLRTQKIPILLASTASLIGEGFDLPELDALILATPLSFEGRMVQYAGRLHRVVDGKTNVQIIDYVDSHSAMLLKMYRNRLKAYRKMGYEIHEPTPLFGFSI